MHNTDFNLHGCNFYADYCASYHCPKLRGCAKSKHDRRIERNCLVVMIVANTSEPNVLMVYEMKRAPGTREHDERLLRQGSLSKYT